ncbi:MAG: hypothetical protein RJA58_1505, partial [Pseudomonadota bacterium]
MTFYSSFGALMKHVYASLFIALTVCFVSFYNPAYADPGKVSSATEATVKKSV